MKKVKTSSLKKGTEVIFHVGYRGIERGYLADNPKRGNVRSFQIEGWVESLDFYCHAIDLAKVGDEWLEIEYTPVQLERRKTMYGE